MVESFEWERDTFVGFDVELVASVVRKMARVNAIQKDASGIVRTFKIDRIASWSRVGELARSRSARSFNRSSDRWPGRDCLNASLSRDSVCRKESASCDI
jgi:hypothetical protein